MSCWEHVVRMNRRENTWKGNKADRQILVVVDKSAWRKDTARAMNTYLKQKGYECSYSTTNAGDGWTLGIGDRDFVVTLSSKSAREKAYNALLEKIDYEGGDCETDSVDDLGGSDSGTSSGSTSSDTSSGNGGSGSSGLSTTTLLIAGGALVAVVLIVVVLFKN